MTEQMEALRNANTALTAKLVSPPLPASTESKDSNLLRYGHADNLQSAKEEFTVMYGKLLELKLSESSTYYKLGAELQTLAQKSLEIKHVNHNTQIIVGFIRAAKNTLLLSNDDGSRLQSLSEGYYFTKENEKCSETDKIPDVLLPSGKYTLRQAVAGAVAVSALIVLAIMAGHIWGPVLLEKITMAETVCETITKVEMAASGLAFLVTAGYCLFSRGEKPAPARIEQEKFKPILKMS
jgi:hypothetical protein